MLPVFLEAERTYRETLLGADLTEVTVDHLYAKGVVGDASVRHERAVFDVNKCLMGVGSVSDSLRPPSLSG